MSAAVGVFRRGAERNLGNQLHPNLVRPEQLSRFLQEFLTSSLRDRPGTVCRQALGAFVFREMPLAAVYTVRGGAEREMRPQNAAARNRRNMRDLGQNPRVP